MRCSWMKWKRYIKASNTNHNTDKISTYKNLFNMIKMDKFVVKSTKLTNEHIEKKRKLNI
jgi:hypothetical protein